VNHGKGSDVGLADSDARASDARLLEESFAGVARRVEELAASLPQSERELLGRLLNAARQHPFIGEDVDAEVVAVADEHIAAHVKPSRRRAREVADRVAALAAPASSGAMPPLEPSDDEGRALGGALRHLLASLPMLEAFHLRELLSNALGGLSPTAVVPSAGWSHAAWLAGVDALTGDSTATPSPQRPAFLTDELIERLSAEAAIQSFFSVRMGLRYTAPPGEIARRFGADDELCRYVSSCVGHEVLAGNGFDEENATYLYYEGAGDAIQPHVDPFGITNALVMIEQVPPPDGSRPSGLLVFGRDGRPTPIALERGEMVVLGDGALVHAREPVSTGERVTLLSLVFVTPRSRQTD
jgi:hypothetical protein